MEAVAAFTTNSTSLSRSEYSGHLQACTYSSVTPGRVRNARRSSRRSDRVGCRNSTVGSLRRSSISAPSCGRPRSACRRLPPRTASQARRRARLRVRTRVILFFVTSSDSGSLVIDTITASGKLDAPVAQRVFWCAFERIVAITLLLGGGLVALQTAALAPRLPHRSGTGGDVLQHLEGSACATTRLRFD